MKRWWIGTVIGVMAGLAVATSLLPRLMLVERPSERGLEETVRALTDEATRGGWVISSVLALDESIVKHGGDRVRPVRLINLCQARYASEILKEDRARLVSTLMPCTVAVYEKSDGRVYVAAMNPGLLGPLFGGVVGRVMGGPVAAEQERFIRAAIR